MNHDNYPDSYIRGILNTVKTIAMVGISPKDNRPSYFAFKYLLERGYRMIPVNPGQAGKDILGQKVYARLCDIPEPVDMVDIFRASEHVLPIVQEALTLKPNPQVIWMQLSVRNDEAAALAEQAGHQGGDEPLPEDRIWPAVVGDFLDGDQFAHALVEARADPRQGRAAHGAQQQHIAGRRDARLRPGAERRRKTAGSRCFHPPPQLLRMAAGLGVRISHRSPRSPHPTRRCDTCDAGNPSRGGTAGATRLRDETIS